MFKNIKQPQVYQPTYRPANNYSKPEFREKPFVPQIDNSAKIDRIMSVIISGDLNGIKNTLASENMHLNIKNSMGKSPIHVLLEQTSLTLSEKQKLNIIDFLVTNGASVTSYDNNNVTPLHLAAKNMMPLVIQYLLNHGAKIDTVDNNGMTPLHYAVQGMPEKCITTTTKVEPLDDSKNIKSLLNQLTLEIIEILKQNNQYLNNIQQVVNDIVNNKQNDIIKLKKEMIQNIVTSGNAQSELDKFKNNVVENVSNLEVLKNLTILPFNPNPFGQNDNSGVLPVKPKTNSSFDDQLMNIKYNQILLVLFYYQNNNTNIKNEYIKTYSDKIFYATTAKITDELIILYMRGILQSTVFKYVNNIKTGAQQFSDLLLNILVVDTQFEKKLEDTYQDILNQYFTQKTNQVQEILYDNKEHIKVWQNNNMTSNVEAFCYAIDQDVIKMLITGQTINKVDNNGTTPIYYAIQNMHIPTIETLTNNGASVKNIRNYNKVTPIEFLTNKCKNTIHNSVTEVLKDVAKPYTNDLYTELNNTIVPYLDIIFPKLIIMFNNFLFYTTKSYINGWSHEDNLKLEQLFVNNNINVNSVIPLLENIDPSVSNSSIRLVQLNKSYDTNQLNVTKNMEKMDNLLFTIINIEKEIDGYDDDIKNQYVNKINRLESKIPILINDQNQGYIDVNRDNLRNGIMVKLDRKYNQLKTKYPFLRPSDSEHTLFEQVGLIQDDMFNEISKTKVNYADALLYNGLWKSYIDDEQRMKNKYNIHLVTNTIKNRTQLKDLFVKVFEPVCNDLFDLEQYADPQINWILTEVVKIITHIVRSVLSSNLYYAIVRSLIQYIGGKSGEDNKEVIEMVNNIINDINLRNYVYDVMPAIAVRSVLKIPYSEYEDVTIYNLQNSFDNILNRLKTNKIVPIVDNSSIIVEMKNTTLPYYISLFTIAITKMKICVDNYAKHILEESKCMEIMQLLTNAPN